MIDFNMLSAKCAQLPYLDTFICFCSWVKTEVVIRKEFNRSWLGAAFIRSSLHTFSSKLSHTTCASPGGSFQSVWSINSQSWAFILVLNYWVPRIDLVSWQNLTSMGSLFLSVGAWIMRNNPFENFSMHCRAAYSPILSSTNFTTQEVTLYQLKTNKQKIQSSCYFKKLKI